MKDRRLLAATSPDVVFTHWPVDTHMDHQVASVLTIRAWMGLRAFVHLNRDSPASETPGL